MKMIDQLKRVSYTFIGTLTLFALLLAGCDSGAGTGGNLPNGAGGKGCTRVGILLPDVTSSVRWESKDHPLLVQAVRAAIPDVQIDYNNANGSSAIQLSQAEADLARGDCILIVCPHDSVAAASIVAKARAQNVPVIAYDRLIQSKDLNYYVSFNNVKVGQLQGQYIATHYLHYQAARATNIAMISGSQTDNNALLFSIGVHSVLDPLFANNSLKNIVEIFTPNWDNSIALTEIEKILTDQQNNGGIQIAYVANDGMANSVINALKTFNLDGKVIVTGQDATITGIHHILEGNQSMTVYKPIANEAQSTGDLVKALYSGSDINLLTQGVTTITFDGGNIPSILDTPISVDQSNVASTVIADKYVTKSDVCEGIPAGKDGVC